MNITPWRWNNHISLLQDEVNRLFEGFAPVDQQQTQQRLSLAPALDVREDDKYIFVSVELPGVDRNDLSITVRGDVLELKGHKSEEKRTQKERAHMRERGYGSFTRRIVLPVEVDSDKAEAKMNNGVLELRLPKAEQAPETKHIAIN